MPINYATAPEEVRAEAMSGFQRTEGSRPLLGGVAAPALQVPHEVFTMDPNDLRQGKTLDEARAAGWRHLVDDPAGISASGSSAPQLSVIEVTGGDGGFRFSHRQRGWMGVETQKAIAVAETLPQVIAGEYSPRMLRLPGVARTDALWLKDNQGDHDLVIPIASASAEVKVGHPYSGEEFLGVMRTEAAKETFDNSPRMKSSGS